MRSTAGDRRWIRAFFPGQDPAEVARCRSPGGSRRGGCGRSARRAAPSRARPGSGARRPRDRREPRVERLQRACHRVVVAGMSKCEAGEGKCLANRPETPAASRRAWGAESEAAPLPETIPRTASVELGEQGRPDRAADDLSAPRLPRSPGTPSRTQSVTARVSRDAGTRRRPTRNLRDVGRRSRSAWLADPDPLRDRPAERAELGDEARHLRPGEDVVCVGDGDRLAPAELLVGVARRGRPSTARRRARS